MNPPLIQPGEAPYIDAIRGKIIAKHPRLLFSLTDEAVKTFCLRVCTSQVVPDIELIGPRPRFVEAIPAALEVVGANPRKVFETLSGLTGLSDEQLAEAMPANDLALRRMFQALSSPYHTGRYRYITDLPANAVAMWPTMVIWLFMYHHRPVRVVDYFAMGVTLALYLNQFNKLPDDYLGIWTSIGLDRNEL